MDSPSRASGARPLNQKCWLSGLVPLSLKLCVSVLSLLWRCPVSGVLATLLDEACSYIKPSFFLSVFFYYFFFFLCQARAETALGVKSGLTGRRRRESLNTAPLPKQCVTGKCREGTVSSSETQSELRTDSKSRGSQKYLFKMRQFVFSDTLSVLYYRILNKTCR